MKKAVHWYYTNKPPLRNWRAYFDSPLPFCYNWLLIVASKLWGRWTLEFSGNNFAAYFYWQLHICHRFYYNKSSCISPTKQKEPLTWVVVSGKTKALHKAAIIMKKALRFRKAIFGAPCGSKPEHFCLSGRHRHHTTAHPEVMLLFLRARIKERCWNIKGLLRHILALQTGLRYSTVPLTFPRPSFLG